MRSRAVVVLVAVCAAGVGALALEAAADERALAFTLSVRSVELEPVEPGAEACQRGIQAVEEFDVVALRLGTHGRPGPPLAVTVREHGGGRTLATGRLAAGAADNAAAAARVAPAVPSGGRIDVCVRNAGAHGVALYGGKVDETPSEARMGDRLLYDLTLAFHRSEPRSALSLVPDMFDRATTFKPGLVGAWTFWVLLGGVAIGIPLLLALALRSTLTEVPDSEVE